MGKKKRWIDCTPLVPPGAMISKALRFLGGCFLLRLCLRERRAARRISRENPGDLVGFTGIELDNDGH